MPVTLDLLALLPATEQAKTDMSDLGKLAQDMLGCPCYQAAWEEWRAGDNEVRLYAARFNGRIVGAGLVKDGSLLSLGVRALTRRRGVGQRMVSVLVGQHRLPVSDRMHPELTSFVNVCLTSTAGGK